MTPKEKALELYKAMYNSSHQISKDSAKYCAIQAVKELLERDRAWCDMLKTTYGMDIDYENSLKMFEELLEEIEKISTISLRKSYKRKTNFKSNRDAG